MSDLFVESDLLDEICRDLLAPRDGEHNKGTGKWRQPGVPHRGWTCTDVVDLFDDGDDDATCEMCETARIRYAHTMSHPNYPETLAVGCICAERMEEDYVNPRLRERELRRQRKKPEVAQALQYVKMADEILAAGGLSDWEDGFVRDMRARAELNARPRIRNRYQFSSKQLMRFLNMHMRVGRA